MAKADIYYFNPTCELAVANGSFSYMPPLLLQEMERDLSILPFIFGSDGDYVIIEDLPASGFIQNLKNAGFVLPNFCRLAELEALPTDSFENLYPWGWSPAAHFKLKNLKEKCSDEFKESPVFCWQTDHHLLFERSTSLNFLETILNDNPPEWFISQALTGKKVTSCDEIEILLKKHLPLVLKAPISSSGRGIQIVRGKLLNASKRQWISGILKQQNYLIAEPFLEKLTDISFQFRILSGSDVDYLGFSIFETNTNGQYKKTFLNPELKTILPEENMNELEEMIRTTANLLKRALGKSVYSSLHRGFLGVDALIFKHQGKLIMQPCLEINSRMNMGVLSLFIEEKIHQDARGQFELYYGSTGEYDKLEKELTRLTPPKIKDGKLYSGFLSLIEPVMHKKFGAYISVGVAK